MKFVGLILLFLLVGCQSGSVTCEQKCFEKECTGNVLHNVACDGNGNMAKDTCRNFCVDAKQCEDTIKRYDIMMDD